MNPGKDDETDDAALFRAAIGPVKPLPASASGHIIPAPAAPSPRRRTTRKFSATADTLSDFGADTSATEYLANGLSRQTLRKLRRNFWPVADRIDLHGLNGDNARRLLQNFLQHAARYGMRCVLIIHGKGMNSPDAQGKLRILSRHWLTQHPQVLAWCEAPLQIGGSGAVLALLKIPEKS